MRKPSLVLILLIVLLTLAGPVHAAPGNSRNFVAHLSGDDAGVETLAQGEAIFHVSSDGTAMAYKLIVADIDNVFAAHIHCAPPNVSGPVGVTLFSGESVTTNGILAQNTVTGPNPENACGWSDLGEVVDAMVAGNAYVNVHTLQSPPGEIRGQIR